MKRDEWILGIVLYALLLLVANTDSLLAALHWNLPIFFSKSGSWTSLVPNTAQRKAFGEKIDRWAYRVWAFEKNLGRYWEPVHPGTLAHMKPVLSNERREHGKEPEKG